MRVQPKTRRGGSHRKKEELMKISEIVEKNTEKDGENVKVNWESVEKEINDNINNIVAKQTSKAEEKAKSDLLKSLNIESEEDLKKKLEDDGSELKTKLETMQKELEERETKLSELNEKSTRLERERVIMSEGAQDPDDIDYVLYNVSKKVSEDTPFEDALKAFKEEKPKYFSSPRKTAAPSGGGKPEMEGFEKYLADRHPDVYQDDEKT